jgi:hypothetical protein
MNLYRLDYMIPGMDPHACPVLDQIGQPWMSRHWAAARQAALNTAADGYHVRITRISKAGTMTEVAQASPETHRIHRVKR